MDTVPSFFMKIFPYKDVDLFVISESSYFILLLARCFIILSKFLCTIITELFGTFLNVVDTWTGA